MLNTTKRRIGLLAAAALSVYLLACQIEPVDHGTEGTTRFEFIRQQIVLSVFVNDAGPFNMLLGSGTAP